jgi:hypothetical protein
MHLVFHPAPPDRIVIKPPRKRWPGEAWPRPDAPKGRPPQPPNFERLARSTGCADKPDIRSQTSVVRVHPDHKKVRNDMPNGASRNCPCHSGLG